MKRGLRIVTGITALITMMFFYGFTVDSKAWADGDGIIYHPQSKLIPLDISQLPGLPDFDIESKSSNKNSYIYGNTTVNTKTYNSNLVVTSDATMNVGTNATITVNGDLKIAAFATVKITSGKLIVNGDIIIDNGLLTAAGTGKITVNPVPATGSVAGKYGGRVIVGDIDDFGHYYGTLALSGSANITINYAKYGGLYIMNGSTFKMASNQAKVTVYNDCYFNGCSTNGLLTAGTLEIINGSFQQRSFASNESFHPNAAFNVILRATSNTKRVVFFETPVESYFTKLAISGVKFELNSLISINTSLLANTSLNASGCIVLLQGSLNGKNLTITANAVGVTFFSALRIDGGILTVNGDFETDEYCSLVMDTIDSHLIINGDFVTFSDDAVLSQGDLLVNGDFYQGADYRGYKNTFTPAQEFITKIAGNDRSIQFENPEESYFTGFELLNDATLADDSIISVRNNLAANIHYPFDSIYFGGNLNGHTMQVDGDLVIPSGNTLTVGGGALQINGDLTVTGDLVMADPNDRVTVSGNFTANSSAASTDLSDGKLYIAGNFAQSGHAASFLATGDHMTILNGTAAQTVNFASASSRFATLVVTNDDLDPSSISSAYYSSIKVTGTTLESLTTDVGALSPGFGADIHEYNVLLPAGTDSVTITPALLDRYGTTSWLTEGDGTDPITSVTVTNVPYDGSKTITVKAHAWSDVEVATYTFRVMQINPDLASLGDLPAGSVLEPAFDPTVHSYTVQLPETAASFAWAPEADHPDSAVHIDAADGPPSVTVALAPGESADYVAGVTAQDGVTEGSYSVTFTRRNPVAGITASAGTLTPAFSAGTANYTVYVPASVPSVTIAALKDDADPDPDWSKFTINEVEQSEITLSPDPGTLAIATIKAWDADNKTVTTYTVTVNRVKMLSGITTSAGALTPTFDAATGSYSVYVSGSVTSVKITPAKTASCTALRINGKIASYVTLLPAAGGKATATIDCTGTGAVTQRYVVNVYRIAPITGITITGGKLAPTFSTATTVYTVSVPATTSAVTVKPVMTASYKAGTLTINGSAVSYVTLRPAVGGSLQAKIRAQAVNGVWYAYTVTVKRAALLTGVRVSPGTLSPAFKPTVLAYTVVRVPATATQVKITPVKASSGVKSVTINGRAVSYAYIKPPVGGSANCTIVATASDGRTKVTYTIKVTRDPLISAIRTSVGALTPAFSPTRTTYTINVPATASSVTITPVKTAYTKTLTIDNKVQSYKRVSPPLGGSVTCTIVATATDGRTKSTYTVRVVRHRPITGITVADGSDPTKLFTLSPAFSPTTLEYNVTVPGGTPQVTITPAKASGYSFSVNGGLANMPGTVTVPPGGTTTAYIVATYPGGSILYKVNVHREDLLTNITVSAGSLNPSFSAAVAEYEVLLDADTASTRITPVVSGCQFAINGDEVEYLDVTLEPGGEQVVTIVVTTSVPGEELTYTVTVRRAGP